MAAHAPKNAPATPAPRRRILAVDDDPLALGAMRQMLVQKGYEVVTKTDGEQALSWLREEAPPDLIILDVAMPGLSGFEVCREIRADPKVEHVPVIFLTGKSLLMDMAEGSDAGSDLYLIKPVSASKLVNMVSMFLTPEGPLARKSRKQPLPT